MYSIQADVSGFMNKSPNNTHVYSFKSVLTEIIPPAQDQYPNYQPLTMIVSSKT